MELFCDPFFINFKNFIIFLQYTGIYCTVYTFVYIFRTQVFSLLSSVLFSDEHHNERDFLFSLLSAVYSTFCVCDHKKRSYCTHSSVNSFQTYGK
jgi:hypothetical protein